MSRRPLRCDPVRVDRSVAVRPATAQRRASVAGAAWRPTGSSPPPCVLMIVLMLVPIVMVIDYSVMDNVIVNKTPSVCGIRQLRRGARPSTVPHRGQEHRVLHRRERRRPSDHRPDLRDAAQHRAARATGPKAMFRAIYILPWLFTVAIIAVVWRLLLNPNGVVNYC